MNHFRLPIIWVLLFLAVVSLVAGRVFWESRKFYRQGTDDLSEGELYMAIIHFGRSAQWYFPGNPSVKRSLRGLWETGRMAEEQGRQDLALKAYYTLRGSLNGTRWLFIPHSEWMEKCNRRIAELTAAYDGGVEKKSVMAGFQSELGPSTKWALLAVCGFWAWVGATIGFVWFSYNALGSMRGDRAAFWGCLALGGFLVWVLGMLSA